MQKRNEHTELTGKRLLFIGHDASMTGAPILLLNLLRLVKQEGNCEISICLQRGGPLLEQYKEVAPIHLIRLDIAFLKWGWFYRAFDWIYSSIRLWSLKRQMGHFDIVFSNTIANGRLLKRLGPVKVPIVSYIHELASVLKFYESSGDTSATLQVSNMILFPSEAVANYLKAAFFVAPYKLMPLKYYFPETSISYSLDKVRAKDRFCTKWQLGTGKLLVVGAGTITLRKGVDRFVRLAALLKHLENRIHFVWIGSSVDEKFKQDIEMLIRQDGIESMITFTGPLPNDLSMFLPFDLFLLTSREDPYPLVVLEAARNGVPAVCLRQNGGIAEFVQNDAGWSFDELSDEALALELFRIMEQTDLMEERGKIARQRYLSWHADPLHIMEQLNVIFATVKNNML